MLEDEGPAAEKRKRELKGKIDYQFFHFDDLPRAFKEQVEGLYSQPIFVLTGGLTDDNRPAAALMDSARRLDVTVSPGMGGAGFRTYQGTYTKGATGTTGNLNIYPAVDDVLILMYGVVIAGGTRVAAGECSAWIGASAGSAQYQLCTEASFAADEILPFPGLGQLIDAPGEFVHPATKYQLMIPGGGLITGDLTTAGILPSLQIEMLTMASAEVFLFNVVFWSMTNQAVTSTESTSDSVA